MSLSLVALSTPALTTAWDPRWSVEDVTAGSRADGAGSVTFTLVPRPDAVPLPSSEDTWLLEFLVEGVSADSTSVFELRYSPPLQNVDPRNDELEPLSIWEITPGDHEAGFGGVVRLELPRHVVRESYRLDGIRLEIRSVEVTTQQLERGLTVTRPKASAGEAP